MQFCTRSNNLQTKLPTEAVDNVFAICKGNKTITRLTVQMVRINILL